MGSAWRSGGSVYRTRPCGQRILVDTVARRGGVALDPPRLDRPPAEGPSVEPRRACEGAPAPCRQTPTAGSLAPRAAMSAAPDSDRAGSGGTGRSSRGPRASSRDRTRGPSETRPAPAGSRVARSTPHRSSTGRPRRAGVADSGKGSRGDRGPPDRAHVPGRSPSPRRTPSRRLSPAPPAARAGAARPVAQAAAPRPTREAARAPAPAQGSAAALAAARVAMRAMASTMAAAASAPAGGPGPAGAAGGGAPGGSPPPPARPPPPPRPPFAPPRARTPPLSPARVTSPRPPAGTIVSGATTARPSARTMDFRMAEP